LQSRHRTHLIWINRQLALEVEGTDSVESLKGKIADGSPAAHPNLQTIIVKESGVAMEDGRKLHDYDIKKDAELLVKLRQVERAIALLVGGVTYTTLLSTLLSVVGSVLREIFLPVAEYGAQPAFPTTAAAEAGGGGVAEGIPYVHAPAGPLPQDASGAYVLDRHGPSFQ
jgi:hypothetical protein